MRERCILPGYCARLGHKSFFHAADARKFKVADMAATRTAARAPANQGRAENPHEYCVVIGVGGSNPLAPTNYFPKVIRCTDQAVKMHPNAMEGEYAMSKFD